METWPCSLLRMLHSSFGLGAPDGRRLNRYQYSSMGSSCCAADVALDFEGGNALRHRTGRVRLFKNAGFGKVVVCLQV